MLRRFYGWQVVVNIGLHFAGSTSLPEMLALDETELYKY